jgi:hypothetical protein
VQEWPAGDLQLNQATSFHFKAERPMSDNPDVIESPLDESPGDDRAPLALAAGLIMALIAGGLWALLVYVTNLEIGYAAWGVGLAVGLAMSRVTRQRTQQLAYAAAVLALLGLVAGKAFIFIGSTGRIAKEFAGEDETLKSGIAWQMLEARELDAATLAEVDSTRAAGDTE